MVAKTCDWCKKEAEASLVFFKPRGWIKHRTPDQIDMLFCSLACFKAFLGVTPTAPVTSKPKRAVEIEEERLVEAPAR